MTSKSSSTIAAHGNRGFTLLELLIVITILAVLSSVVLIILQPATLLQRARDSRRMSDLQAMQKVIERIILDTGTAPPVPGNPGWCTQIWNPCYPEVKNLLGQYMAPVPQDPSFRFEKGYFYRKESATGYTLAAIVERPENANGSYNEGGCNDSPTTTSCIVNPGSWTTTTYNYIIQVVRP